jgi:hypothetical protein
MYAMDVQATTAMVALTAGSVVSSNFSSIVCWDGMFLEGSRLWLGTALVKSAKLGSHGGKDFTKIMAISKGMEQRR